MSSFTKNVRFTGQGRGRGRGLSLSKGLEGWRSTRDVGNDMWLAIQLCQVALAFPPEMQKTEHTSAPLPPTGCSGVGRGRVVPVHCCSMAWTWASVNSQQYASFFHSWGRRCLEASRHSTEWNCCVSCRWSCLKVKFFPEGSLGSLHNTWSCGADPKSAAATRGDIPARLSLRSLDGVLASSQAWGFWFLTLCLALTSTTPAAHIVPPSRTPFLTSLSLNPIATVKRPSTCHLFQAAFPIPLFSLCAHSTSASRRTQQLWLTPVKPRIRYLSRFAESQQVVKGGVTEFFYAKQVIKWEVIKEVCDSIS